MTASIKPRAGGVNQVRQLTDQCSAEPLIVTIHCESSPVMGSLQETTLDKLQFFSNRCMRHIINFLWSDNTKETLEKTGLRIEWLKEAFAGGRGRLQIVVLAMRGIK
ncbi:hypothetical protein PoB_002873100 [Plakobranchus ocellatus]|uniref:Uncharacterized protein n=1 Tax=Plakobranchus ocellatus TaxID=259542 RepID=A0AAV4A238_9GAST|nr:hypothetical protein PoB_002873100 [Plakobranchus ocellatus]